MSGGIVTLLIIVAIIWYTNYRENKQQEAEFESYCQSAQNEKKNEGSCNAESVEEAVPTATRSLVLNVLNRIGCEPKEEDEVNIRFTYQGENFLIEARDDVAFINILDLWWYQLSTYCDVEEFARLQKVINTANRDGASAPSLKRRSVRLLFRYGLLECSEKERSDDCAHNEGQKIHQRMSDDGEHEDPAVRGHQRAAESHGERACDRGTDDA